MFESNGLGIRLPRYSFVNWVTVGCPLGFPSLKFLSHEAVCHKLITRDKVLRTRADKSRPSECLTVACERQAVTWKASDLPRAISGESGTG